MSSLLSLFTGDSKWVYFSLVVCALGFAGMTKLSISLYADKTALEATINKNNELIEVQAKEVRKLSTDLARTKADLQTQNALNERYSVDLKNAERKYSEAMAKKPPFKTQYMSIDRTDNEAKDLQTFVKKWRARL